RPLFVRLLSLLACAHAPPAFLSYYRSPRHRDLPSFPTRRSSDLIPVRQTWLRRILAIPKKKAKSQSKSIRKHQVEDNLKSYILEDRKSTRLNSSHVSISYAVFCLKKKTQARKPTSKRTTDGSPDR